jgi:hypothetical protein
MATTFKTYLANAIFEGFISDIKEENILDILEILKKKVQELLSEGVEDTETYLKYLKVVAMFEQLFRFLKAKKIDPTEIIGFKSFIDKNDLDTANEDTLASNIEKILNSYDNHQMISFKRVVEKRFNDFKKWFMGKKHEDLQVIKGAVDFTITAIDGFNQASHVTH